MCIRDSLPARGPAGRRGPGGARPVRGGRARLALVLGPCLQYRLDGRDVYKRQAHVAGIGWQDAASAPSYAGTVGQGRAVQAEMCIRDSRR